MVHESVDDGKGGGGKPLEKQHSDDDEDEDDDDYISAQFMLGRKFERIDHLPQRSDAGVKRMTLAKVINLREMFPFICH